MLQLVLINTQPLILDEKVKKGQVIVRWPAIDRR